LRAAVDEGQQENPGRQIAKWVKEVDEDIVEDAEASG
jgi:hypothetical protein